MFEGPADELTLTENTQPGLLAASMMAQKVLEAELGKPIQIPVQKFSHLLPCSMVNGTPHESGQISHYSQRYSLLSPNHLPEHVTLIFRTQ